MTDPAPNQLATDPRPAGDASAPPPAPSERGWGKLFLALAAFVLLPITPYVRALLPMEQTMMLFVPAVAACALVGWWAGGRAFFAIAWVAIAVVLTVQPPGTVGPFSNLARGWSLLLAGAFGIVCLLSTDRPFFTRAMAALVMTLGLATVMAFLGPVSASRTATIMSDEFSRRNGETMAAVTQLVQSHPKEWQQLVDKIPALSDAPNQTEDGLASISGFARTIFPSLLALESLAALALAWATYHRLGRTRLGAPLKPLREFRFNDQLVWGLIVGLTTVLVPTLSTLRGLGQNLLVFFGTLYAVRGLGVLSWFMAPGSLGVAITVGVVLLFAPVLQAFALAAFLLLAVAALALGLGDTWADWRGRAARPAP
ncbi:MAG TPA: DUF2232 domain-containing protein [Gemmatimonadaceae bacterium]|nr:DUF2232 domain-containing protein [Gemmatimonadaceae bacterium]